MALHVAHYAVVVTVFRSSVICSCRVLLYLLKKNSTIPHFRTWKVIKKRRCTTFFATEPLALYGMHAQL